MSDVPNSGYPEAPVAPIQWWRYLYRVPMLLVQLLVLTPLTLLAFAPGIRKIQWRGAVLPKQAHRAWSKSFLAALGIQLRVHGHLPEGGFMLVANHISWLDILVLHAVWPVRLVAKSEIRHWPVVGRLAQIAGTVFITRGSESSRRRVERRLAALLRRGERVGVFPEGGIVGERGVGRFHARLFGAAVRAQAPVVPVAIRYDRNGDVHAERVFAPGMQLSTNLLGLIGRRACTAEVLIGEALSPDLGGRSHLARLARNRVVSNYEQPVSA